MSLLLALRSLLPTRNRDLKAARVGKKTLALDNNSNGDVVLEESGAYLVLNRRVDWDQSEETWYILTGLDFEPGDRLLLLHGRSDAYGDSAVATRKMGTFGPSGAIHRWAITFTD